MRWIVLILAILGGNAGAAAPWWQPLGPIKEGMFSGGHADQKLSDDEKKTVEARSFDEWTTYEDDLVRFRYPKDPKIKLEVTKQGQPVKVEGGVCTTVDNRFQHAYVIKVGKASYGLFLVNAAEWLDDGICFCGPMIHDVYSMRENCLVRYSLLPGNAVKKAQWLGGGLRVMAFEWTHLACKREIYEEMVNSMVLKVPSRRSEADFKAETARRYGLEGRAGWLHPGMTEAEVTALMGGTPEHEGNALKWTEKGEGLFLKDYLQNLSVEFDEDRRILTLTGVGEDSAPLPDTLSWVDDQMRDAPQADPSATSAQTGSSNTPPPKASAEKLAGVLRALSPEYSGPQRRPWVMAVLNLKHKRKHQDAGLLQEIIRDSTGRGCEMEVLQEYGYPDLRQWVAASLAKLAARKPVDGPFENEVWLSADASALLEFGNDKMPEETGKVVDALIAANQPYWTRALLEDCHDLTPLRARRVVVQGIDQVLATRDAELMDSVSRAISLSKFDDRASVRKAVEKLPRGKPGSEFAKQRKEALVNLATKKR